MGSVDTAVRYRFDFLNANCGRDPRSLEVLGGQQQSEDRREIRTGKQEVIQQVEIYQARTRQQNAQPDNAAIARFDQRQIQIGAG